MEPKIVLEGLVLVVIFDRLSQVCDSEMGAQRFNHGSDILILCPKIKTLIDVSPKNFLSEAISGA